MAQTSDSWNPAQYHQFQNERSQPFFDLLSLLEPTPNPAVIDLGCGSGELTKILHEKTNASATTGLDSSPNMLEKAKSYAVSGERALTFTPGNIDTFHAPGTYDLIFSNAALQWCENHATLFEKLRDSLKAGGQLAIQMPMNHDHPSHLIAAETAKVFGIEPRRPPLLAPEEYSKLLYTLGFQRQSVNLKVYAHLLPNREGVIEWVKGTLLTYYQNRLTPEGYHAFLQRYRELLFQKLQDEKPFFYPFKRILLWASLK